jgi:hypothetical protein
MGEPLILVPYVDLFCLCNFLYSGSPPKHDMQKLRKMMLQYMHSLLITFNVQREIDAQIHKIINT